MADFKAGKLIIGVVVYFIFLVTIMSLISMFANEYNIDNPIVEENTPSFSNTFTNGYCDYPRIIYKTDGTENELSLYSRNSLKCELTQAQSYQDMCNNISGCSLQNYSFSVWFIEIGDPTCTGYVNLTDEFGVDPSYLFFDDVSGAQHVMGNDLREYIDSYEMCNFFGMTWIDYDSNDFNKFDTFTSVLDIIGAMFSYRVTFTDDATSNALINTILFYIPLIMLIVAIYFAIRG